MEVKVGDHCIRNSDRQICKVKRIDNKMIVFELEDENRLILTSLFTLEKAYIRKKSQPTPTISANLPETKGVL